MFSKTQASTVASKRTGFCPSAKPRFGFRNEEDTRVGVFNSSVYSQAMWTDANSYLNQYGSRLDIVYDDPQFINEVKMDYATIINWTSGAATEP